MTSIVIYLVMYENPGLVYAGMQRPSVSLQPTSFENALYGAGSDLIQSELGAYGEKLMESSSAYVQSNISKYFADPQYYFQVNDQYVKNKLKVLLFPFLHKGHWTRTTEPVNGKLSYKPPIYDINAPDLYIPLMAFGTYVVLAGFSLGLNGKFSPDSLSVQFSNGLLLWLLEVLLLKATLNLLGNGEAPLLDICAYGGYVFASIASAVLARILSSYLYYAVVIWEGFCMAVFLVKTMKRVLFVEMKCYENNSYQRNYVLLFVAVVQFPLLFCISNISAR